MDDLISRQAAIDAFDGVKVDESYCTEYDIGYNDGIDFAVSTLSVLPSAEKWVLCSQRLPEKTGNYLVTKVDNITNEQEMDIAYYADWLKQIVGNNGFYKHAKVVAWMPLPEPYKKGENG